MKGKWNTPKAIDEKRYAKKPEKLHIIPRQPNLQVSSMTNANIVLKQKEK
jgi:hypothetical protein